MSALAHFFFSPLRLGEVMHALLCLSACALLSQHFEETMRLVLKQIE